MSAELSSTSTATPAGDAVGSTSSVDTGTSAIDTSTASTANPNTTPSSNDPGTTQIAEGGQVEGQTQTPAPVQLTPEEYQAKLAEYEPIVSGFKPLLEKRGSVEAVEMGLALDDALSATTTDENGQQVFDAQGALNTLQALYPEQAGQILWEAVAQSLPTLVQDPNIRDAVFNSDPDIKAFLDWREAGGDPEQLRSALAGIDENLPESVRAELEQSRREREETRKEREAIAQQKAQAEQQALINKVHSYDQERISGLEKLAAQYSWGEQYQPLQKSLIETAKNNFNSDTTAIAALNRARNIALRATSKDDPSLKAATKVVENHLARHYAQIAKPINDLIRQATKGTQAVRAQQAERRFLDPNGQGGINSIDWSKLTEDQRVEAKLERARAEGRFSG